LWSPPLDINSPNSPIPIPNLQFGYLPTPHWHTLVTVIAGFVSVPPDTFATSALGVEVDYSLVRTVGGLLCRL